MAVLVVLQDDIFLDLILEQGNNGNEADQIFQIIEYHKIQAYVEATSLSHFYHSVREKYGKRIANSIFESIYTYIESQSNLYVIDFYTDRSVMGEAFKIVQRDEPLEIAVMLAGALTCEIQTIITRNNLIVYDNIIQNNHELANISIMTPRQFIDLETNHQYQQLGNRKSRV